MPVTDLEPYFTTTRAFAACADPAWIAGEALFHRRPEVIDAALGKLLGHQPGQPELGTGRPAGVCERGWVVQPTHEPAR